MLPSQKSVDIQRSFCLWSSIVNQQITCVNSSFSKKRKIKWKKQNKTKHNCWNSSFYYLYSNKSKWMSFGERYFDRTLVLWLNPLHLADNTRFALKSDSNGHLLPSVVAVFDVFLRSLKINYEIIYIIIIIMFCVC